MSEQVVIKEVIREEGLLPISINFENGNLKPGQESNVLCEVYENQDGRRTVVAASNNMLYSGALDPNPDLYNNYIVIRDKRTNEAKLIAVDHVTLSPIFLNKEKLNVVPGTDQNTTVAHLNKNFGSKKIKRHTEQLERMKIDVDIVKEQLEETVQNVDTCVDVFVGAKVDENTQYRPPINRNATRIEDAYPLQVLVSAKVLNSLYTAADEVKNGEKLENTCDTVSTILEKLMLSNANHQSYELLLYIDILIKFYMTSIKQIQKREYSPCSYSQAAALDILNKFTVSSNASRMRPHSLKDKCVCYLLVLCITMNGYKLDLGMLSKDIKIGLKKLQEMSRVLSFSVDKNVAVLKLPLPAPLSVVKKDKAKKR